MNNLRQEEIKIEAPLGKSDHSLIKLSYQYEAEYMDSKVVFDYNKGD